jgi:NADP-dependent 3-hydroxy acid dehydrogenase YdfG
MVVDAAAAVGEALAALAALVAAGATVVVDAKRRKRLAA